MHVLIPAGGTGTRFDARLPKQFHALAGKSVLAWTVEPFIQFPAIETIWINHSAALPVEGLNEIKALVAQHPDKIRAIAEAGATRAETVRQGALQIMSAQPNEDPWVLVHDAARPGLSVGALTRLIDALIDEPVGAILAIPASDTLKEASGSNDRIQRTLPRDAVWQAQTPQAFRLKTLLMALEGDLARFSDEASAVEAMGLSPRLVLGEAQNFKITRPEDGDMMATLLKG